MYLLLTSSSSLYCKLQFNFFPFDFWSNLKRACHKSKRKKVGICNLSYMSCRDQEDEAGKVFVIFLLCVW